MSYTIYKSDGTAVVVPDNAVDAAYFNPTGGTLALGMGTQLIGRNTINYGTPIAQNFLQMTENFASVPVPSDTTSLQGQLWFNKTSSTTGNLYVRLTSNTTGGIANWAKLVVADSSGNSTVANDLTVTNDLIVGGSITSGGSHVPVVNPTGTPIAGDIQVVGSVISMYANGAWQQIFPATYS